MELPKLILTDIDGVWTDGGMFYDEEGNELKKFNTYDSAGVLFAKMLNIPVGIITGENTKIVKRRAKKLQVEYLYLGAKNKLSIVKEICKELEITLADVAFIGDDINDLELLKETGFSAVPNSAPFYMKKYANIVMTKNGGDGVFREFVEDLIASSGVSISSLINQYLDKKNYSQ